MIQQTLHGATSWELVIQDFGAGLLCLAALHATAAKTSAEKATADSWDLPSMSTKRMISLKKRAGHQLIAVLPMEWTVWFVAAMKCLPSVVSPSFTVMVAIFDGFEMLRWTLRAWLVSPNLIWEKQSGPQLSMVWWQMTSNFVHKVNVPAAEPSSKQLNSVAGRNSSTTLQLVWNVSGISNRKCLE